MFTTRYGLVLFNPLNAELNPTCHLLALLGAHYILHVSRIRVNIIQITIFCGFFGPRENFEFISKIYFAMHAFRAALPNS